jgi:hypothetical protein
MEKNNSPVRLKKRRLCADKTMGPFYGLYFASDAEDVLQHQHYDLEHVEAGRVVEVALDGAANVRIMNHASYQEYRVGRRHVFLGGFVTTSPYRAAIPEEGHWHVVLDLGGQPGRIRSGVRVLPRSQPSAPGVPRDTTPPAPAPARASSLGDVPSLVLSRRGESRPQDVFILYVPEDRAVVRAFAFALRKQGLRVAYDEYALNPGGNVHRKVSDGLRDSSFGVAVVSRALVKQGWAAGLAGLAVKPFSGKQVLLLLWHDIMRTEALEFCADIAGLKARHTAVSTFDELAEDIAALLQA